MKEKDSFTYFQYDKSSKGTNINEKIKDQIWRIVEILLFRPSFKFLSSFRCFLLRLFGAKIGKDCYISNRAIFVHPWNLIMGNNIGIDDYAFINSDVLVQIDDYVSIASFAHIFPSGHNIRSRNLEFTGTPIHIGYGSFIGTGAFIGPGVNIGSMAVVGSNTSVYKDVPTNTVIYNNAKLCTKERISKKDFDFFIKRIGRP